MHLPTDSALESSVCVEAWDEKESLCWEEHSDPSSCCWRCKYRFKDQAKVPKMVQEMGLVGFNNSFNSVRLFKRLLTNFFS